MSAFSEDFLAQLRTDLAQALTLPPAAIYVGREAQKVTRVGLEVWIRPGNCQVTGGIRVHSHEVCVRHRARREGDQTGAGQFGPVIQALDVLCARFDGTRPFVRALPLLVAVEVDEHRLDNDAEEQDVLMGSVTLRVGEAL